MAAHQPGEGKGKGKDGGWRSWGWNTWDYIWLIYGLYMDNRWIISGYGWYTLWLCQNNFGKWLEIVDFCPLEMVMFHSYVMLNYQRVCCSLEHWQDWCIKQDTIIWDETCFFWCIGFGDVENIMFRTLYHSISPQKTVLKIQKSKSSLSVPGCFETPDIGWGQFEEQRT